ncbi:MAG: ExeM/NucH family extracellular endonuclease [Chloroflexota bacterium]
MKVQRFLSVLFLLCLLGGMIAKPVQPANAGVDARLLVNEFYRGGTFVTDEWVELVVLENLTASMLQDYYVGDSTGSTAAKFSGYRFTGMSNIGSQFERGTIIVIGGTTQDLSYDPANGDWNIALTISGGYLTGNGSAGDFAGTDVVYVDTNGTNGNASLASVGFAVNWDSTPGTFGGVADVTIPVPNNNSGAAMTADREGATSAANWTVSLVGSSLTPGQPNGGANTTWVQSLRTTSDTPPAVSTTDPIDGSAGVATSAGLAVTFSEPVTVTANWAQVSCSLSGVQSVGAGTLAVGGGPQHYTLEPASDFLNNETCTATLYAAQVTDRDGAPDPLAADYAWTFSTAADVPPAVSLTNPANGAADVALSSAVAISFSEAVDLAAGAVTLACGGEPVTLTGLPAAAVSSVTLLPGGDLPAGATCNANVAAGLVTDRDASPDAMASDYTWSFSTVASGPTRIHTVQGAADASPLAGQTVTIEGIVVGDFQATVSGFFMQEEDHDADADPLTSEGIFVYSTTPVNVRDRVSVTGVVTEYYNETELTGSPSVTVLGSANPLPAAISVTLPVAAVSDWERYEGMLVTFPQDLYVSETYLLGRGGMLSLADQRIYQPTHLAAPGAPALAVAAENARHTIFLDDGSQAQNTDPIRWPSPGGLSAANTVRNGYQASGVQGVVTYRYHGWSGSVNAYRIYPTIDPIFAPANPRAAAPARAGTLRIASFNVLNYFNGNGSGGGFPTSRGAETPAELERQRAKIVAAIIGLDADVIGLMEIENDGYGPTSAIQDLVNGLNAAAGAGTYNFIDPGVSPFGGDEIAVGLLYRPASVTPVGAAAYTDAGAFTQGTGRRNRQPLAQSFEETASGERFTVVVNHFKSKGSDCATATAVFPADPDLGDGQGNCNLTRTMAAQDLIAWLATDPTGVADPDVIVVGDLNAYAREDPITAFRNAGYVDLPEAFLGSAAYSYVFDGQLGYLDHALASPALAAQVTAAGEWHINADEPISLDYNTNFKSAGQVTSLYAGDAYRASDHDPVVIDLFMPYGRADLSSLGDGYGRAWHRSPHNAWLGATVGDDLSFAANEDNLDDDGVARAAQPWLPGETVSLTVQVGGAGPAWLAAWFDWDSSGAFEAGELGINRAVSIGSSIVTVTVPITVSGTLPVRFRLYESAAEPAARLAGDALQSIRASVQDGGVTGGEVEDYRWDFGPTAVDLHAVRAVSRPPVGLLATVAVVLGAAGWLLRRRFARAA